MAGLLNSMQNICLAVGVKKARRDYSYFKSTSFLVKNVLFELPLIGLETISTQKYTPPAKLPAFHSTLQFPAACSSETSEIIF